MSRFCLTIAHAFRRMALPLMTYYAVTLGLPLANGAWQAGATFVKHALPVLLVPPVAIVLGSAAYILWSRGLRLS